MVRFRVASVDEPAAHDLIAEYFAMRSLTFPKELGEYSPKFPVDADFEAPNGVFLVVVDDASNADGDDADIGCGGVRRLAPHRFEIKHLYLQPHTRGRGLGRLLLAELERRAHDLGATEIVLDTNASLTAAGGLYRSAGYENIDPYNDNPNATDWYRKTM